MTNELISFDTAKLAKEKGFNVRTQDYFISTGEFIETGDIDNVYTENWNKKKWVYDKEGGCCFGCKLDNIKYFEAFSAPTQTSLQRWLREVPKIHININCDLELSLWEWDHRLMFHVKGDNSTIYGFKTYEQALEKGLQEALKLIKNES